MGGEVQGTGAHAHAPGGRGRRCGRLGGALLHPAYHALDARAQLARIERFGDVIVGAHLEADDAVHHVAGGGDHDDSQVVPLAQVARQAQAVLAGQVDVQQHDIRHRPRERRAHLLARPGLCHLVAMAREVILEHGANLGIVVDDQNMTAGGHRQADAGKRIERAIIAACRNPSGPARPGRCYQPKQNCFLADNCPIHPMRKVRGLITHARGAAPCASTTTTTFSWGPKRW
jgi:hypothetical protein